MSIKTVLDTNNPDYDSVISVFTEVVMWSQERDLTTLKEQVVNTPQPESPTARKVLALLRVLTERE